MGTDEVAIEFPPGTTTDQALAAVANLELSLVSGDAVSGRYLFRLPTIGVEQLTADTALVSFPTLASQAEILDYLRSNNLRVLHWLRNPDRMRIAIVRLPLRTISPKLVDAVNGTYQMALPAGLSRSVVANWMRDAGLALISYDPLTGIALGRALRQARPVSRAPLVWKLAPPARPVTAAPRPAQSPIYIRFSTTLASSDIKAIGDKLGLTLSAADGNGLVMATADPARVGALLQLLSDQPGVECAAAVGQRCSVSPQTATPVAGPATPPVAPAVGAQGQAIYADVPAATSQATSVATQTTVPPQTVTTAPVQGFDPACPAAIAGATAGTPGTASAAPATQLDALPGNGHMRLCWTPVSGAVGYRLYRSDTGAAPVSLATTSLPTYLDQVGQAGSTYTYTVAAFAANGVEGTASSPASARWPAASPTPVVLQSTPPQADRLTGSVRLQVVARSSGGIGTVTWAIKGALAALTIGSVKGQPTTYDASTWSAGLNWDSATVPDGTYTITATVVDLGGNRTNVGQGYRVQNAAPEAPTRLTATAKPEGTVLAWQQPANASPALYRIYRDRPALDRVLAELPADQRSFVDRSAGLTSHRYAVVVVDAVGRASQPAYVNVAAPKAREATAASSLQFEALLPSGRALVRDGRVSGRLLLIAENYPGAGPMTFEFSHDGLTWASVAATVVCGIACEAVWRVGLLASGPYLVRATTSVDGQPLSSPSVSLIASVPIPLARPILRSEAGPQGVILHWSVPEGIHPIAYAVWRRDGEDWRLLDDVAAMSYLDASVPAGGAVAYRVQAIDRDGAPGTASIESQVQAPSRATAPPSGAIRSLAAPANVRALAGTGEVTIAWEPVSGAEAYAIDRARTAQGPFIERATVAASRQTYSDPVGGVGDEAYYRVRALASDATSAASATVAAIDIPTLAPGSATFPPTDAAVAGLPVAVPATPVASASASGIRLTWAPVAMAAPVVYNVYRFDPRTSGFTVVATGLSGTSFQDTSLDGSLSFGYVLTASDQSGTESRFSAPAWVESVSPSGSPPQVTEFASAPADAAIKQGDTAAISAAISSASGVSSLSFYFSPDGTTWHSIPGSLPTNLPNHPRSSLSGEAAVWTTSWNTSGLKPGSYSLRIVATDVTGRSSERSASVQIQPSGARGPPASFQVNSTPMPNGASLKWSGTAGSSYQILRSIFGTAGPFQPVATTTTSEYQDNTLIPGFSYTYRVVEIAPGTSASQLASVQPVTALDANNGLLSSDSRVRVQSPDPDPGLAVTVAPVASAPALPANLRQVGSAYSIDAVDLGSGDLIHQLVRRTTVAFRTTPGTSEAGAMTLAIYHYDENAQSWSREASSSDVSLTWVSAEVWHFSLFALAAPSGPDPGGQSATPPVAPTDFRGAPTASASTPTIPAAVPVAQVAANGEVVSKRTETSTTYRNADGSLRTVISTRPVHFMDAAGKWQDIDATLVPTADGGMRNAADAALIHLPADLSTGSIDISNDAGQTVRMTLSGAGHAPIQALKNQGRYAGVLAGVDAEYSIQPGSVKERLILQAAPTRPLSFTYTVDTGGLVLQPSGQGFNVVDGQGTTQFTIGAPIMEESIADKRAPSSSTDIAVRLVGARQGHYLVTYTPSASWLADPARIYPVAIDPSMSVGHQRDSGTDERDTFVGNGSPTGTFNSAFIDIGRDTNTLDNWTRGLLSFSYSCPGCWASSASLSLYQRTNWYYPQTLRASEIYQPWNPTTATWNNQPGSVCPCVDTQSSASAGWVSWNVLSIVRDWEQGIDSPGLGILIRNLGEFCACYDDNLYQAWDYSDLSMHPNLTINYEDDRYGLGVTIPTGQWMPGVNTTATIVLQNQGVTPWDSTFRLSYRWVQPNGTLITDFTPRIYLPYTPMNQNDYAVITTNLTVPNYSSPMYLQFNMVHENVVWFSAMNGINQYGYNGASSPSVQVPQEIDTITGRNLPAVIVAQAGSLLTIPITITNNSIAAWNYTWQSSNHADIIRVGSRDYRSLAGSSMGGLNGLTYLPADVLPGQAVNVDPVFQVPSDPGDYNIKIDLVRDNSGQAGPIWFEDRGNPTLSVRIRVLAPGEDKAAYVPIAQDDGSTLGVNTSNGYATAQTTDFDIAERGTAHLRIARTYNGANSGSDGGVGSSSAIYGAGWTFDFQRSVRFGGWGGSTRSFQTGILTDAQGRSWGLTWNAGRALWEDAAGDRTITASTALVDTPSGPITVPGVTPVDVVARNGVPIVSVGGSPRGPALSLTGSPPNALVMPAATVPVQQSGSIEFWFSPNFNMATDTAQHVLFNDVSNNFKLAWNTDGNRTFQFITSNGTLTDTAISAAATWAQGTWHHIGVTWQEGKGKQLLLDQGVAATGGATHGQAPIKELFFGYNPSGTTLPLNAFVAELRVEGRVVPQTELQADGAVVAGPNTGQTLNADPYTLYLGTFVNGVNSTVGVYTVRNANQSTEDYDPATGRLVRDRDRFGNTIHYSWDAIGRLTQIYDESMSSTRYINLSYQADSILGQDVIATDFSGRTVTYQVDPLGNLILATKSNRVPDPLTGLITSQPAPTKYSYVAGHNLYQVTDARNSTTTINYITTSGPADVYRQGVLGDSPVAYYRLNETSGTTAADSSGSNLTGTLVGGVTVNASGALPTSSDTAFGFNGTSSYVDLGTPTALNLSTFTVEAWWDGGATQQFAALVQDRIANQRGFQFSSDMQSSTVFAPHLVVWDGVNEIANLAANVTLPLPFTGYAHMVWTWDGTNARFFLNGQPVSVNTSGWHGYTSTGIFLGRDFNYLGGHLDEVAIYRTALPAARILRHYNLAFAPQRVNSVTDARLNTVATFDYNDSFAVNRVQDGNGASSYYTFQQYGGRTMAVTDTGGNTTTYDWDGGAAYRLNGVVSPTGVRTAMLMNSGAAVGQQGELLMQDMSNHPGDNRYNYVNGSFPSGSVFGQDDGTTATSVWDTSVELQPGIPSHVSPAKWTEHQHYFTAAANTPIPSGATATQWVYLEPGQTAPSELMLQFHNPNAAPNLNWEYRAYWGLDLLNTWGTANTASRRPIGAVPPTGVWVPLTVTFGPTEWGKPDVGMAGLNLDGIAFTAYGGTGKVWWGPMIFDFPPPNVTDPVRTTSRYAYTAANDQVAIVDPLGIGTIRDVDTLGLARQDAGGVEPPAPVNPLWADGLNYGVANTWSCENSSFTACAAGVMTPVSSPQYTANGMTFGSLQQSSSSAGGESDLYHDWSGLNPGTYIKVSAWVQTSGSGVGGAGMFVEDLTAAPLSGIASLSERRTGFVQSPTWVQLTVPFIVTESGQIRIHLRQWNFNGTTTWANVRVDDITPVPATTFQESTAIYATDFELTGDRSAWALHPVTGAPTGGLLQDATLSHGGQWNAHLNETTSSLNGAVGRTITVATAATYLVSAWVRTVANGTNTGTGGASLRLHSADNVFSVSSYSLRSEGQWRQLQLQVANTTYTSLLLELTQANFQGDTYFDDVTVQRIDQLGAWSAGWTAATAAGAVATWSLSPTAGLGGVPARRVTITTAGNLGDISDKLTTSPLHTGYSYVISLWASSNIPGTTIDLTLRDGSGNLLPQDFSSSCILDATATLCQNAVTYTGTDNVSGSLTILYGGQGARDVYISHPLIALSSQLQEFTSTGHTYRTRDLFGHEVRTDYDSSGLYPVQQVEKQAPNYWSLGWADGAIDNWTLGDAPGSFVSDGTNAHSGTAYGTLVRGERGPLWALQEKTSRFDGTSAYVEVPYSAQLNPANALTVEAWAYVTGGAGTYRNVVASRNYVASSIGTGYQLDASNTDQWEFWVGNGTGFVRVGGPAVVLNQWTHLVGTYANGVLSLYADGNLAGTTAGATYVANTNRPLRIGAGTTEGAASYFFPGLIGDVWLYGSALSQDRARLHFWAARGKVDVGPPSYPGSIKTDAPVAEWRLGEQYNLQTSPDSTSRGNPLYFYSGIAFGTPGAIVGDPNTALTFSGPTSRGHADRWIDINPTTGPWTLEAWVNPSWLGQAGATVLSVNGQTDGSGYSFGIGDGQGGSGNRLEADFYGNGWIDSGYSFPAANAWYHVVVTRDAPSIPLNGTFSAGSGTLAAGTYYYRVSTTWGSGQETPASTERSYTLGATGGVTVAWTQVTGATGYRIYGRAAGTEKLLAAVGSGVTSWLDNGSITPSSALPASAAPTTRFYVNGVQTPNISTLAVSLTLPSNVAVAAEVWNYDQNDSQYFGGAIDEPAVYGTALSAARIVAHYQAGTSNPNPPTYSATTLADSPAGYWRLSDSIGNTTGGDQTGNGNNLTIGGGVALGSPGTVQGDGDKAMTFMGNSSSVARIDSDISPSTGPFTLEAWINPSFLPQAATIVAVANRNGTGAGYGMGVGSGSGGSGSHLEGWLGGTTWLDSGYTFPTANAWYHVVMTRDAPSTPVGITLAAAAGNLAAGTYAYRVTATWGAGKETAASLESSVTLASAGGVSISWGSVSGASGYRIYGRSAGGELLLATIVGSTTSWLDDGSTTGTSSIPTSQPATIRFYVNGIQTPTASTAGLILDLPTNASLGYINQFGGQRFFAGTIDEAAIYNTALTSTKVTAHWLAAQAGALGLTQQFQYDSLGQLIATIQDPFGSNPITDRRNLDSWGRVTAEIRNLVPSKLSDPQTNVWTGHRYDANGNEVDQYDWSAAATATTPLTAYLTSTNDANIYNTRQLITTAPAIESSVASTIGTSTGYGELCSAGCSGGWGSTYRYWPSGYGFAWDSNALDGQQIPAGNWTPTVKIGSTASPNTLIADVHVRVWNLDWYYGYWKLIADAVLGGQSIDNTNRTFTLPATSGTMVNFYSSDHLYVDVVLNVTSNTTNNSATTVSLFENGGTEKIVSPGSGPMPTVDTHMVYDANGNRISHILNYVSGQPETSSQNNTTNYTYDVMNELTHTVRPAVSYGGPLDTMNVYDSGRRLTQVVENYNGLQDPSQANVTTSYVYDPDGRVKSISEPVGRNSGTADVVTSTKSYDALGRLVTDVAAATQPAWMQAATAQTDYTLDADGRTTDVTNAGTGSPATRIRTHYTYDALGRAVRVTYNCVDAANGSSCGGTADFQTNVSTQTIYDPRGAVTTISPPTQAQPLGSPLIASGGVPTRTDTDFSGRTISVTKNYVPASPSADIKVLTRYSYDTLGQRVDVIDPLGYDTRIDYDNLGRQMRATPDFYGLRPATTYGFNMAGDRTTSVYQRSDGSYRTDLTQYDALHRATAMVLNSVPSSGQDAQTNITTSYTYDDEGRVVTTTDPILRVTRSTYDALGRKVALVENCVDAGGVTCGAAADYQTNVKTQWQVDKSGEVTAMLAPRIGGTDGINLTTTYAYDAQAHLVQVVNDAGSSSAGHFNILTKYSYDPAGHRLNGFDGNNNPTTLTLDSLGRVTAVKDAVNNVQQTHYSAAGEVVDKVNGRLQTNALTLDRLGRVSSEAYFRSDLIGASITFTYDAKGEMTSFQTSDTTQTSIYYDGVGRVTSVAQGSQQTSYRYFSEGPVSQIVDPAETTNFTIDQVGNLSQAQTWDSRFGSSQPTRYQFDSAGRLSQRQETNGPTNVLYSNFQYSALDQLIDKNLYKSQVGYVGHWANITYDVNGNRLGDTITLPTDSMAGTEAFTYDTTDRLATSAQPTRATLTYGYDAAMNRMSVTGGTQPQGATSFSYLANEALSTETPSGQLAISYTPDADGNVTRDAAGHQLKYDSLNRLDRVLDSGGALQVSYVYDALGRLVKRTAGSTVTQYVYQGLTSRVVEELDGSNNLLRAYTWDTMGRQLGAQIYTGGAWKTFVLATDPHGDVVALVDGTGTVIVSQHFDAWGQVLFQSGQFGGMPFGFQDGFTDAYTGFVLMGARWYDPRQGRFTAEDPRGPFADARNPLDENLWAYAMDSPERYVDPTGLWPWDTVVKTVSNAWNTATHWVSSTWNSASDWASDRWDEGSRFVRHVYDSGVHAVQSAINTAGQGAQRVYNWGRRTVAHAWHAVTRTAHYFAKRGVAALGMVARPYINLAKGAVSHVMHVAQAARDVATHVTRVVVNTVGQAASAVGGAVKTAWNFCTGSARGASTCLAVAASVALIASGVGAGPGVGLLATTLFTASSVASAVSFAQTGDPMDALGAIPAFGVAKDAELAGEAGAKLAQVTVNRQAGLAGEAFLRQTYGGAAKTFGTSMGRRVVDNLINGTAMESKVGRTALTSRIAKQVQKDSELIKTGQVSSAEWHFFGSSTGIGPTQALENVLNRAGIGIVLH